MIWVDRAGQKPIVIGARGERLKRVGASARLELNALLGRRLHLNLWVKVREDWADKRAGAAPAGHGIVDAARGAHAGFRPAPATPGEIRAAWWSCSRASTVAWSVFAQGVRGSKARLAAVLQPFAPLLVSWAGRGEAPRLTGAEPDHGQATLETLRQERVMSAWYVSELVLDADCAA